MPSWLFGAAIALLVGAVVSVYLWFVRRRDDETAAGLVAIAGMRWREFSRLVLEAMAARGLRRVGAGSHEINEESTTFVLHGHTGQWLLACKHGIAYRIGSAMIEELAAETRLYGAQRAILVTEGILDRSGVDRAGKYGIELMDGRRLWPQLKPLMDPVVTDRITSTARARALRHIGIGWLCAVTLGLLSALALSGALEVQDSGVEQTAAPPASAPTPTPAAPAAASPPAATAEAATAGAAGPDPATPAPAAPAMPGPAAQGHAPMSEAQLEQARATVSRALTHSREVSRGVWISRSTLAIDRNAGEHEALNAVCTLLAAYPDLSLSRIQINPPPGSNEPVRWRRCQS